MEQSFLSFGVSVDESIKQAIDLLQQNGYYVIKQLPISYSSIKSSTDLVEFFYSTLQFYNPDRILHYAQNINLERKLASSFVKSRMITGCDKKRALQECALIIKSIIENEDRLNLTFKITSMSVLGQDSLKWITDRAISIINHEVEEIEKADYLKYNDELCLQQEKEALLYLDDNITHLKKVLGDL